jgi:hypothetical protein
VTQWTSLSAAARNKEAILNGWYHAYAEAFSQGRAGKLEPNEIVNPGNEVVTLVPDERVRHYFLRNDNPTVPPRCSARSGGCSAWTSTCGS